MKNQHLHSKNGGDIVLSLQDTQTNKWTEVRIPNEKWQIPSMKTYGYKAAFKKHSNEMLWDCFELEYIQGAMS
jgi:hypothetical protein